MLVPITALLFFGMKLEHSAGLLLLPPLLIHVGEQRSQAMAHL